MNKQRKHPGVSILSIILLGGLAVFLIGGYFFLTAQNKKMSEHENTSITTSAPTQFPSDENVTTINIEAGSYYYKPNESRLKRGQKVRIVMTSVDMMHDFNIDELNLTIPITRAGNTATMEFTPDKIGQFEFYCSVNNHKEMGQKGILTVEE